MARRPLREDWAELGDEELLDLRMADLPLTVEGILADRIAQLRAELHERGLGIPLHFYIAEEWFTPDGATAIAIPFYLAHPRLERLEEAQMFEVEGGEHEWGMRILRHEAGHAIDNAYKLRLRRARARSSASPPARIRSSIRRGRTARASCCIWMRGTRRAIPTRTSPRPLPSG